MNIVNKLIKSNIQQNLNMYEKQKSKQNTNK